MAWHTVTQAQKLTGKSRRTLYRDMASGLVSYRANARGFRELETSELIRHYGELASDGTETWPTVAQPDGTENTVLLLAEIRALRAEVTELKTMMLRIEDKSAAVEETSLKKAWWKLW